MAKIVFKWQKLVSERPEWSASSPSLTRHLETLKMSPPKEEEAHPRHSSAIVQNFTQIGRTVAEISVPGQVHRKNYRKFSV